MPDKIDPDKLIDEFDCMKNKALCGHWNDAIESCKTVARTQNVIDPTMVAANATGRTAALLSDPFSNHQNGESIACEETDRTAARPHAELTKQNLAIAMGAIVEPKID